LGELHSTDPKDPLPSSLQPSVQVEAQLRPFKLLSLHTRAPFVRLSSTFSTPTQAAAGARDPVEPDAVGMEVASPGAEGGGGGRPGRRPLAGGRRPSDACATQAARGVPVGRRWRRGRADPPPRPPGPRTPHALAPNASLLPCRRFLLFLALLPACLADDAATGGDGAAMQVLWRGPGCCGGARWRRRAGLPWRTTTCGAASPAPPAAGALRAPARLDLSANSLRGGVPMALGTLPRLESLDLSQ
jgi:hypothetical protein